MRYRCIFLKGVKNKNSYRQPEEFKAFGFVLLRLVFHITETRGLSETGFFIEYPLCNSDICTHIFTLLLYVVHFQSWKFNFTNNFTLLTIAAKLKCLSLSPFEYWDSSSNLARNMSIWPLYSVLRCNRIRPNIVSSSTTNF